jgi:hypothetical protein
MEKFIKLSVLLLLLNACSEEAHENKATLKTIDTKLEALKLEFGKALSNSLSGSLRLRQIIKEESLKKFNGDYDVLFPLIKSELVENGKTVEDLIKSSFANNSEYYELLKILPTLTIMVPKLPNNSFSAEIWDANIVPAIAIKDDHSNDAKIIFTNGKVETLEGRYTPGFPVLVIKKSETIIDENHPNFSSLKTEVIRSKDGVKFKFIDNYFNSSAKTNQARVIAPSQIDQKLIDAATIYNQQYPGLDGWHRDYIYYNITPTNPVGPFRYDFMECITTFRMSNPDAMINYNILTNSTVGNYLFRSIYSSRLEYSITLDIRKLCI